ncbi:hypothetical protein CDL12_07617 [Handroanthus impetiginosus]|uniref:Uncharacterized protein n=1 Tax=Handroanthus impetiginosus TaxID=429701 RepID=A0A2G9HQ99_9LAMI|nr:hypothetical protein CDL12_07617 [Handroanthus impetiginosus]
MASKHGQYTKFIKSFVVCKKIGLEIRRTRFKVLNFLRPSPSDSCSLSICLSENARNGILFSTTLYVVLSNKIHSSLLSNKIESAIYDCYKSSILSQTF